MRIVLCNAIYPTETHPRIVGGAEVFCRQFAEALTAAGDTVEAVRFSPDGRYFKESVNGVTVHFLPVQNLFPPFEDRQRNAALRTAWHLIDDWRRAAPQLQEILRNFQPDLFHSNTLNGLSSHVWHAARRAGLPVIHTLHDYYLLCPKCSRFKDGHACETTCGSCRLLTEGRRRRTRLVDAVVGVSSVTLNLHLREGLFADTPIKQVIRNAPAPTIRATAERPGGPGLTIGYLGRFSQEKGVHLLVEAAGRIRSQDLRLRLAGRVSAEERDRLAALAPGVDLDFVGFVDPMDFYKTVDVVAVPSIWEEPSALALNDALAAGKPIIGTPFGGIPEQIEDGKTGWVVEPSAEAFAALISGLMAEPGRVDAAYRVLAGPRDRRQFSDVVASYRALYADLGRRRQAA